MTKEQKKQKIKELTELQLSILKEIGNKNKRWKPAERPYASLKRVGYIISKSLQYRNIECEKMIIISQPEFKTGGMVTGYPIGGEMIINKDFKQECLNVLNQSIVGRGISKKIEFN
jgi:hypothetical protein